MELKENPWQVDNLQAFSFLCCPECIYKSQEETSFEAHAIQNHPLSSVFFSIVNVDPLNVTPIKEEVTEDDIFENGEEDTEYEAIETIKSSGYDNEDNINNGTFEHLNISFN